MREYGDKCWKDGNNGKVSIIPLPSPLTPEEVEKEAVEVLMTNGHRSDKFYLEFVENSIHLLASRGLLASHKQVSIDREKTIEILQKEWHRKGTKSYNEIWNNMYDALIESLTDKTKA
jgi:hypothetical protein